ncbi:venom acid phosphatase Acph-1-like [Trichoplusia ni]|uniref:acid phosphatase n=1 Tax=Trichoplusia ni TaxID=7111 RepID=A0A7E5WCS1_TRINI|nr:venom acid phosphatase Acph-1-like [Trichoplusia ni]
MELVLVLVVALVGGVWGEDQPPVRAEPVQLPDENPLADTEILLAFVIFRHGDRTPDQEELDLFPSDKHVSSNIFFPFGKKALTNKGKQRAYLVGKYLRERYDGLISKLYLPDEITVRTTDYERTQMTALAALAGLYPPSPAQQWHPSLDWQPIPYDTPPADRDDLLYWYNCPVYLKLRDKSYELPNVKKQIDPYRPLFEFLSNKTGTNVTKPEEVFFIDNLFQTLSNVGVDPPKWAQEVMPQIREVTRLEYATQFHNADLVRIATGVLMQDILNITSGVVYDNKEREPKLYLYSAHENNVAALMSASRVYQTHQPSYGATFSLELRRNKTTGDFGISAVYAPDAGGPGLALPIEGCQDQVFCEFDKFAALMQDVIWTQADMDKACRAPL